MKLLVKNKEGKELITSNDVFIEDLPALLEGLRDFFIKDVKYYFSKPSKVDDIIEGISNFEELVNTIEITIDEKAD